MLRRVVAVIFALALAAFFAFVGWNKAFATLADLARYHAWTVYIPEALGRAVGWSEMALAAGLLGALVPACWTMARASALLLVANQVMAATVHIAQGEADALPQNGLLIAALLAVAFVLPATQNKQEKETA